jgi:hypothetical protein
MPSVYQIKFLPGGESRKFYGSEGDSYVLEDDNRIDVLSLPVWCHLCHDFSEGEMIEGLEEIDRQPADLRDPESELYRLTIDAFPTDDGCPRLRPLFTESLRQKAVAGGEENAPQVPHLRIDRDHRVQARGEGTEPDRTRLGRDHGDGPL